MKIATILDHIDIGHMALPEFQRGYVWNRDQVRGLFDSLHRRHPVGGLLVWVTGSKSALMKGGNDGLASFITRLSSDPDLIPLKEPVAVLLNEDAATMSFASQAGFRYFVDGDSFREYVMKRHL